MTFQVVFSIKPLREIILDELNTDDFKAISRLNKSIHLMYQESRIPHPKRYARFLIVEEYHMKCHRHGKSDEEVSYEYVKEMIRKLENSSRKCGIFNKHWLFNEIMYTYDGKCGEECSFVDDVTCYLYQEDE